MPQPALLQVSTRIAGPKLVLDNAETRVDEQAPHACFVLLLQVESLLHIQRLLRGSCLDLGTL